MNYLLSQVTLQIYYDSFKDFSSMGDMLGDFNFAAWQISLPVYLHLLMNCQT